MMRSFHLYLSFLFAINFCFNSFSLKNSVNLKSDLKTHFFTENKGQVCDQNNVPRKDVIFSGSDRNMVFHLRKTGISYQLYNTRKEGLTDIYRIDIDWINSNPSTNVYKNSPSTNFLNFCLSHCPVGVFEVRSYKDILYKNIYEGIDVVWKEENGHLKYDYKIAAGADYKKIQMIVKGSSEMLVDKDGRLVIKTPHGKISEEKPYVIQGNKVLKAKWKLNKNVISFDIIGIDPALPFIIDPIVREWGTFYGGVNVDDAYSTSTDPQGNVFLFGTTALSTGTTIATVGSHQATIAALVDCYLSKFNAQGVRLWATYYGGAGIESAGNCETDNLGNTYICGRTSSTLTGVMSSSVGHQPNFGGANDVFLAKFDANGVRQWATFYGGSGDEYAKSCCTDLNGNVYLTGYSASNDPGSITTPGCHQAVNTGSMYTPYLVKFNSSGVRQWGTYFCGDGGYGESCCADSYGNVYVSGSTDVSTGTFVATPGSHQPTYGGGFNDAFLVKFDPTGTRLWGTYYGGGSTEVAYGCCTDIYNNVYIVGETSTNSGTMIASPASHQPTYGAGGSDGFIAKFNQNGIRKWATYYGGNQNDHAYSCSVDPLNSVWFCGRSSSSNGNSISTPGSFQSSLAGSSFDSYLVKLDSNGVRSWATYYGGISNEWGTYCATDVNGNAYMCGNSSSSNAAGIISSSNGHQFTFGGAGDGFLVKFIDCILPLDPINTTPSQNQLVCSNKTTTLSVSAGTNQVNWYSSPTATNSIANGSIFVTPTLSPGTYTYFSESISCAPSATRTAITITVNSIPNLSVTGTQTAICPGQNLVLNGNGASSYTWIPGGSSSSISISPTVTSTYTLIGQGANSCANTITVMQIVNPCTGLNSLSGSGNTLNIFPNPSSGVIIISAKTNHVLEIFDLTGHLLQKNNLPKGDNEIVIDELSNGMYFFKFSNGSETKTVKIIKQ